MNYFLKQLNKFVDTTNEEIEQIKSENNNEKLKDKLSEIEFLVDNTNIYSIPMTEDNYKEFYKGLLEYVFGFIRNIKKKPHINFEEKIYWVLYLGFPYSLIKDSKV